MNTTDTSSLLQEGDPKEEIKALREALREKSEEIDRLNDENRDNGAELAVCKTVLYIVAGVIVFSIIVAAFAAFAH